jgi:hypothetical protein
VLEEACCEVQDATLLGYTKGHCLAGHEAGLVIIRSIWRASVAVLPWNPEHEMLDRLLLPPQLAMERIDPNPWIPQLLRRAFYEALGEAALPARVS